MEAIDIVLEGAIKLGVNKKGQSELIKFVLDNPKYHYSIVTNHRNLTHIMHDISGLMRDDEFFVPRVLFDNDNEYKKIEQMEENNKLIAEFMGMENERHSDGRYLFTTDIDELKGTDTRFWEQLYFHVSWDWLMPVVRKCKELVSYEDSILYHNIEDALLSRLDRDDTYRAVVEFINEYNRTNGSNETN